MRKAGILRFLPPMLIAVSGAQAAIWYVDDNAPPAGTGASWSSPMRYLQDALTSSTAGDEIHVAGGNYTPDRAENGSVTPLDRTASFVLRSGVALRGGYAGLADLADPDRRDLAVFVSTLNG